MVNPEKYEDSNVFVNRLGIRDYRVLMSKEASITAVRSFELMQTPKLILMHSYDLSHAKSIHRYLFQDIYEWAGCIRSYDMSLCGDEFTPASEIEHYFESVLHQEIDQSNYMIGLHKCKVIECLSRWLGLMCLIHPFPEGNGRTQRIFISMLAHDRGYLLDWSKVHHWENKVTAQNVHRNNDYSGMKEMIAKIILPKTL